MQRLLGADTALDSADFDFVSMPFYPDQDTHPGRQPDVYGHPPLPGNNWEGHGSDYYGPGSDWGHTGMPRLRSLLCAAGPLTRGDHFWSRFTQLEACLGTRHGSSWGA